MPNAATATPRDFISFEIIPNAFSYVQHADQVQRRVSVYKSEPAKPQAKQTPRSTSARNTAEDELHNALALARDRVDANRAKQQTLLRQANAALFKDLLDQGELVDAAAFSEMMGSNSPSNPHQLPSKYLKQGRIVAVEMGKGPRRFPAFQIDPDSGKPYAEVAALIARLPGLGCEPSNVMALLRWMDQRQLRWDGSSAFEMWANGKRQLVIDALTEEIIGK
jgi:hypothetical protein